MKTLDELRRFYDNTLLDDLNVLENKRKEVLRKSLFAGIALFLVAAAVFFIFLRRPQFLPFVIVPVIIIWALMCKHFAKGYRAEFKNKIIQKIVTFLDKSLTYHAQSCVAEGAFMSSGIFKKRPDRYRGDDLVSGKLGATQIEFSEVHSEYKTTTTDSKGHTRTQWHTIFKGLFFMGDFNKHFSGRTYVLPDTAEKLFGRLGQKLQSLSGSHGELLNMEDPEFEKLFVVYGSDQIEARYILSTSLMRRIVDFKSKTGRKLYLGFVGSQVWVAIEFVRDLFEPRVFRTLLNFEPIQTYFEDLQLALDIVEDLNLNTRIWSKQ